MAKKWLRNWGTGNLKCPTYISKALERDQILYNKIYGEAECVCEETAADWVANLS
jgi:hypothetical protein